MKGLFLVAIYKKPKDKDNTKLTESDLGATDA